MLTWSVCLKKCIHVKIIPKSLIQRKKTKYTPSGYSLFTNCLFNAAKNKLDCHRRKDSMEKFCKDFRQESMRIVNYDKKK